jgi:hypothetical protein
VEFKEIPPLNSGISSAKCPAKALIQNCSGQGQCLSLNPNLEKVVSKSGSSFLYGTSPVKIHLNIFLP